jgi:hypothetical protein
MTQDEQDTFLRSIGKIMDEYSGRVAGTMTLMFIGCGPDGGDVPVTLTFPDWAHIGSVRSSMR